MNKIQSLIVGIMVVAVIGWAFFSNIRKKTPETISPNLYNKVDPYNKPDTATAINVSPSVEADLGNTNKSFFLTIMEPQNNITVTSPTIFIKGKTMPDAEVFVNDKQLLADKQGNFTVPLELGAGDNEIMIFANDSEGNMADKTLNITYTP